MFSQTPLPAILIGGPPHSGKSVLAYSLSQTLRQRGVAHYLLRAYPDGEGDWANEADQTLVKHLRQKGEGTRKWIDQICADIERRHLSLIVDVGGRPTPWQEAVFDVCTHAILLTPHQAAYDEWHELVTRHQNTILADLRSILTGHDVITTHHPILEGQISGLERGSTASGPIFGALVDRVINLISVDEAALRTAHLALAPISQVIELDRIGQALGIVSRSKHWLPEHLPLLLNHLPAQNPLALYDRAPNWLYAALAIHTYPAPFYQFDPRLGWITPPSLAIDDTVCFPLSIEQFNQGKYQYLEIRIEDNYLDYDEAQNLSIPQIPQEQGVVISGKLPLWLWSALARSYGNLQWVAIYQPQLSRQAVIVASRTSTYPIGSLMVL